MTNAWTIDYSESYAWMARHIEDDTIQYALFDYWTGLVWC